MKNQWLNVFFSEQSARTVLPSLFAPLDPFAETGGGHIGLYVYPRSVFTAPFVSVPQDSDYVFLLVLGRDNVNGTDLQFMRQSNR